MSGERSRESARPAPAKAAAPPARAAEGASAFSNRGLAALGGGAALSSPVRGEMERAFGEDFSGVRIHDDAVAARNAAALGANAYTHGDDIAFAAGRYAPSSTAGRALLAHELAHVAQQRAGADHAVRRSPARTSEPGDALERSAEAAASTAAAGGSVDRAALGSATPGETLHRQPTPPPAGGVNVSSPPPPTAKPQTMGPEIRQGPIGDVVYHLDDWVFWDGTSLVKSWEAGITDAPLIPRIPIPDLGVSVRLDGSAHASAMFVAGVGPAKLTNIQLGLSYGQAVLFDPVDKALVQAVSGTGGVFRLLNSTFDDFRALADIEIPANLSVSVAASGSLKVAAEALGLFDVATLSAGLSASAGADANLTYRGRVGLYGGDGKLEFHFAQQLEAQLALFFELVASVDASLLGFHWGDRWTLARADKAFNWSIGEPLAVSYNNGPKVDVNLVENAVKLADLASELLSGAPSQPKLDQLAGGGGAGGGAPGGGGGPATAPRGTRSDPIDMLWFKSPGLYPISITLGSDRYFFTEPDRIAVPDDRGFADIRRNADSEGKIPIGVSPSSKYYPKVRQSVWPRVRAGTLRTGTKQSQFRRLLTWYGYAWGSQEADHVRDLQWAGDDAYDNLWPLERAHNNAANQILDQPVTYTDRSGVVRSNVPLKSTPVGLYFRIIGFS